MNRRIRVPAFILFAMVLLLTLPVVFADGNYIQMNIAILII